MAKLKPKPAPAPTGKSPNNALNIARHGEESEALAIARALTAPGFRHGMVSAQLMKSHMGENANAPGVGDYATALNSRGTLAVEGDLKFASRMLALQASTLDTIFAEMARRMALNAGEYLGATETYARIALKAQANSRATLEVLAKLHQPREQTVRHVHVNEGGQAVVADQFHHHAGPATGGQENGKSIEQPHATGTGAAGACPALPSPNPFRQSLPVSSGKGEVSMQNARRKGKRRSQGQ